MLDLYRYYRMMRNEKHMIEVGKKAYRILVKEEEEIHFPGCINFRFIPINWL